MVGGRTLGKEAIQTTSWLLNGYFFIFINYQAHFLENSSGAWACQRDFG
jgi:hypothetical protein